MKLNKIEINALLGFQARQRELVFMKKQIELQMEQLKKDSNEFFAEVEMRLEIRSGELQEHDVDMETGELIEKVQRTDEVRVIDSTTGISNGHVSVNSSRVLEKLRKSY